MREEIEAAALFITRLVNKNLSNVCSTTSSIHSHSSSASSSLSSSSSTSSDGAPDFDDQQQHQATTSSTAATAAASTTTTNSGDHDKVEQFKQCLQEALFERFHNHWFPEQPTKGQAYRCIRLNEWDRRDITLQKVCTQCGIDYKDLQLPVELTLWVDPDEVTCRFGENKGSHCLVAKFKEGELKDNNIDLDINNIDIEFFRQTTADGIALEQGSMHAPTDYNNQHNRSNNDNNGSNTTYQFHNQNNNNSLHQQQQQQQHQQNHQTQLRHQHQQQSSPHHFHHQSPHRANMGKAAPLYPSYHHGYSNGCDTNGNPIPYYYF
uniref:Protein BTG3 n=1 Tax=Aceria tosichella TaxID=561515 RepID=A0A6G1SPA9_9ACAR